MNEVPVFQKVYDFYRILYHNLKNIPKQDRFTWGEKAERCAYSLLSLTIKTSHAERSEKPALLKQALEIVDLLTVTFRLGYDLRILDRKKNLQRTQELHEIGQQLGKWKKSLT